MMMMIKDDDDDQMVMTMMMMVMMMRMMLQGNNMKCTTKFETTSAHTQTHKTMRNNVQQQGKQHMMGHNNTTHNNAPPRKADKKCAKCMKHFKAFRDSLTRACVSTTAPHVISIFADDQLKVFKKKYALCLPLLPYIMMATRKDSQMRDTSEKVTKKY